MILFNNSVDVFQLNKKCLGVEMKIQSWAGKKPKSTRPSRTIQSQYSLGFRLQMLQRMFQFGPGDLLKADGYMMAVINNQYLDNLLAPQ